MTLGLYVHRSSPIHAMAPGWKLIALAAASVAVFATSSPAGLAACLVAVLALFPLARLPVRDGWRQIRPTLLLLVCIVVAHGLLNTWTMGAVAGLRFAILVLLASLISLTTRVSDMLDVIERALTPLAPLGLRPAKVGLVLALAIRLVPLVFAQASAVREAQRARGLERSPTALFVPLIVRMLRTAAELADAIEARGFDGDSAGVAPRPAGGVDGQPSSRSPAVYPEDQPR
jgi:biotin transport system permease protein